MTCEVGPSGHRAEAGDEAGVARVAAANGVEADGVEARLQVLQAASDHVLLVEDGRI
jgi:hypothetical protein